MIFKFLVEFLFRIRAKQICALINYRKQDNENLTSHNIFGYGWG